MAHLNYDGLKRYDKKTKEYIDDKTKKLNVIDVDELATKTELENKANKTDIFSGSYNDLTDKPNIPSLDGYATEVYVDNKIAKSSVDLTVYATKEELINKVDKIAGKSLISDVEIERLKNVYNYDDTDIKNILNKKANTTDLFSRNYDDLINKPTIPDISNLAAKTELKNHTDNTNLHVTLAEKNTWNAKLDNTDLEDYANKTYVDDKISEAALNGEKVDLSAYAKTSYVDSEVFKKVDKVTGKSLVSDTEIARLALVDNYDDSTIKQSINAKASISDVTAHTSDTDIHITSAERTKWNNKAETSDIPNLTNYATKTYVTDAIANAATGGTVDLSGYAKTVDVNSSLDAKVDKVSGKSLISDAEISRLSKISNYDDTSIKSSITSINSQLTEKANKSELFSRSYNDLTDKPTIPSLDGYATQSYVTDAINQASLSGGDIDLSAYAKTADVNTSLSNKVDKIEGKGLSTNDYTTDEKTKVSKIVANGDGSTFLASDGTYKKVSSSTAAVAERKFKPSFGFDTYWGEIKDTKGNKNQVDLATIKTQIDQCEEMKVDKIICTLHIAWNESTSSLVIAENTDSLLSAISYCEDKNVTIDTVKVHMQLKGTSTSINNYVNNVIGMSTFQTAYKSMLTTICNLFKNTTVTRITILNEMWYITNSSLGYSTFINECLNLVKNAGYSTGITMAGFTSNQKLADAVIKNIDTFYINVYPGISGSGAYITKQEAIEAFKQCDIDLWVEKLRKKYPDKKVIISEMGTNDYWECLAAPSSWDVTGATKTGGYAVDTYITAMMEFFIKNNTDIEELWWWYDLYYAPVKETLLNYLGGEK